MGDGGLESCEIEVIWNQRKSAVSCLTTRKPKVSKRPICRDVEDFCWIVFVCETIVDDGADETGMGFGARMDHHHKGAFQRTLNRCEKV